jgi:hypothetical protein
VGRICDATGIEDEVLEAVAYQNLLSFYEEQAAAGHWHPSFTESVGDFTHDAAAALVYYRRALDEARRLPDKTHSILICMAQRLHELGQTEQAEACLFDGRAEAVRRGDKDCVADADRIQKEMSA